jgi:hypothetical protein
LSQAKPPRIGFVSFQAVAMAGHVDYLRDGLRQLGYIDSKAIEI